MKKGESRSVIPAARIEKAIYVIRDNKVMLDIDLAALYGVETRALIQSIKRNLDRFPLDFAFKLEKNEWEILKSQIVTSSWGGRRYTPYAFTEQGVAMLSSVIRSPQAVKVNIEIMRAFIRLRQTIASHQELSKDVADIKNFMLKHSRSNDREFKKVWQAIEKLSTPPPEPERRKIGFDTS